MYYMLPCSRWNTHTPVSYGFGQLAAD